MLIVALVSVFIVRLADIQVVNAAQLNEQSDERRTSTQVLHGARGDIVDANGTVMATSVDRWAVTISPMHTRDIELEDGTTITVGQMLKQLGEITGQDPNALAAALQAETDKDAESNYLVLATGLDVEQYEQVRQMRTDWQLPYIDLESRPERTYPLGSVGGNVIGFEGTYGESLAGLELMQDACLAPTDGSRLAEVSPDGTEIPGTVRVDQPAVNGGTLQLTIDSDLQFSTQQILAQYQEDFGARSATAIVLRKDGTVAAIAETPTVDPNNPQAIDPQFRGARTFTNAYEPGSTLKSVTLAAMIDQGHVDVEDEWTVPWQYQQGPVVLNDSFVHGDMPWTTTGILANSSNVGMVTMAEGFDRSILYDYFADFGFGETSAIEFLGEQPVQLRDPATLDDQTTANQMFGQGIAVTPIQMASSYLPFANEGKRPPVQLVSGCTNQEGETASPKVGDPVQVLKPETASDMNEMMEVMVNESSQDFGIDGYRISAKTGTAEVAYPDGSGYDPNAWIISTTGVFPTDEPEYVVHVMIEYPIPSMRTTGAVGAFHDIVNLLIRHDSIPPSTTEPSDLDVEW
ncbi:peptidoglycan D,D-transpeptidase FtsI family protein [Agrococcus casei]|uniref:peptidoglycan D,D-transpeptidase FtsI family protein n=1 Tax=Agrococcus casei TaxID=343512 RepID=UPI0026B192E4